MLNLAQVETFLAVIEEGGFREAARRLRTSQPTITQHIKKLEATVGAQLVERSHALCKPTADGARFVPYARRLLKAEARARAAIRNEPLHIGASSNIGTYILQPRLKAFLDGRTEVVRPSLSLDSNPRIADRLASGDLGLGLMEWWDQRPGFKAEIWSRERLVVIVPPGHPWAKQRAVRRQQLLSTAMIGGEPGSGTATLLRRVFGEAAAGLQISMALGSTEAVKQAVMAGLGVSIVIESAIRDQADAGLLCALPIAGASVEKELFVVLPDDTPSTSLAAAFAEHLRAASL